MGNGWRDEITMTEKIELEGELFVLVEETLDEEKEKDVKIVAEVGGVNVWDWLRNNDKNNVKIILEKLENDTG